jgi:hypothetical protein
MIATKAIRKRAGGDLRALVAAGAVAAALLIGGAGGYALGNMAASSNLAVQAANPIVQGNSERASSERLATSLIRVHGDGGARDPWSR